MAALVPYGASIYDVSFLARHPLSCRGFDLGQGRGLGGVSQSGHFCSCAGSIARAGQLVGNQLTENLKNLVGRPTGYMNVLDIDSSIFLLAQDAQTPAPGFGNMLVPLTIIMVLFYFMILRPQKNKEQSFRSMVDNLKEKDRIVTIGGIHGVVTNVQRERDEVTIRVDESTGAKIRIGTSAIARVVTDEDKNE